MLRQAWRLVIAVIGGTVVLIGVAMIVLPGPAIVVIPAGLAILATEFVWARRLLARVRERIPWPNRRTGSQDPPEAPRDGSQAGSGSPGPSLRAR